VDWNWGVRGGESRIIRVKTSELMRGRYHVFRSRPRSRPRSRYVDIEAR
jgi:hypothetical protein